MTLKERLEQVQCDYCGAPAGEQCFMRSPEGRPAHFSRARAALGIDWWDAHSHLDGKPFWEAARMAFNISDEPQAFLTVTL